MIKKYSLVNKKSSCFIYGADYNPDQWIETPEIWDEDMRLMKLANCNVMTLGIFSWSSIEPQEGQFEFEWLDTIMDRLEKNGVSVILATPSGARPAWLSEKYPEVLRTQANRVKNLHGQRHNHCFTSPIYREKVAIINRKLAQRYKNHPALMMWHISNEYGGDCHCTYCQDAFRNWLKNRYDNDLNKLNSAWWTGFWSHKFTSWSQIQSPSPQGEIYIHGHILDWKRFVTYQTIDFYKAETTSLRELTPKVPITTNFMGNGDGDKSDFDLYDGLNYAEFAKEVDVVSYDSYPLWHIDDTKTWELAAKVSFVYDACRALKGGRPFLLMESTPSLVNWHKVNKIKRPGMNILSSYQAIAHGADSVQYFQWRKSRGGSEKFHGAVVDHCGHENTRVFKEVAKLGGSLKALNEIVGTSVKPEVAVIFDWENGWAIKEVQGITMDKKEYQSTCVSHYKAFWTKGVPVDVIDMERDFSEYKILIAPMLYMIRPGVAERIEKFVNNGGTFITTYFSGMVDESDLCYLGGFPGPLRAVTGIWSEEIDSLYDTDCNAVIFKENNKLGIKGEYEAKDLCDVIHAESAEVIATYKSDYYAGMPALTVNNYGKGKAYYIASRNEQVFLKDFYNKLIEELKIRKTLECNLPEGVTAQLRSDGETDYIFILNFSEDNKVIDAQNKEFIDMFSKEKIEENIILEPYGIKILKKKTYK